MTANLLKTIPVAIAWVFFFWRGYIAYRERRISPARLGGLSKEVIWIPTLLLLLAGTTWNDLYIQLISEHVGKWFLYVPRVALGISAFVVYTYGNARFQLMAERYLPSWRRWAVLAGILTVVDFALLQWLGWHLFPDRLFAYERLAGLILKSYLLIVMVKIALPYMRWCQIHEQGIIFKTRLNILWWSTLSYTIWMSIDLAVLLLSLGTESSLAAVPFVMIFLLSFTLGVFIPDWFYERYLAFLFHLGAFVRIRLLELVAYRELEGIVIHRPFPTSLRAALQSPEHATYKSVISILDCSKILCAQPEETLAGSLGRQISQAYTSESDYLAIVNHLWEVVTEQVTNIEFLKVLLRILLAQIRQSMRSHEAMAEPQSPEL